jgi:predicted ATPase
VVEVDRPNRQSRRRTGKSDPAGLHDQRFAMIERVQAVLESASASRPVLVVLDDLQWADPESVLALGSLARSLFST